MRFIKSFLTSNYRTISKKSIPKWSVSKQNKWYPTFFDQYKTAFSPLNFYPPVKRDGSAETPAEQEQPDLHKSALLAIFYGST
jgi:hypothetical protein